MNNYKVEYRIFTLHDLSINHSETLMLEEACFDLSVRFDSMEDALSAINKDGDTFTEYIILPVVYTISL